MTDTDIQRLRAKLDAKLDKAKHREKDSGRTSEIDPSTGRAYENPVRNAPSGRIWVRFGARTRTDPGRNVLLVWHKNRVTTLKGDIPVTLVINKDGDWEVESTDTLVMDREYGNAASAFEPSADPAPEELSRLIINRRNISDFRPRVADSGGLNLYVAPGWYRGNEWAGGTLDVTAYVTATSGQYAYIVVGFDDDTGALVADTGPDYATAAAADSADIATVFSGATFATARPIAAVLLQNGATTFLNADITDIRDLTALGGTGTGAVESIVAGTGISVDSTDPANPVISATGTPDAADVTYTPAVGSDPGSVADALDALRAEDVSLDSRVDALEATPVASALDDLTDVDVTTVPPTDGQALVYDAGTSTWGPSSVAAGGDVRDRLTANRTYYVRTDGSDSNAGLTNTAGGAFLTMQKAINVVSLLDLGTYHVTIQVGPGTYTSGVTVSGGWLGMGTVTLQGDTTTPSNVVISTTNAHAIAVAGPSSTLTVKGFKIQTATAGSCFNVTNGAVVLVNGAMEFGATASFHVYVTQHAHLTMNGIAYAISGGATAHLWVDVNGSILTQDDTITLTGTPAFATQYAHADSLGMIYVTSATFIGTATGGRYAVATNAMISTNGGGASYLPGTIAGTAASGGQYV